MSDEERARFVAEGRNRLTDLNNAIRRLDEWGDAFVQRGGMAEFGNDAALINLVSAKVQGSISEDDRVTVSRLRTDV